MRERERGRRDGRRWRRIWRENVVEMEGEVGGG